MKHLCIKAVCFSVAALLISAPALANVTFKMNDRALQKLTAKAAKDGKVRTFAVNPRSANGMAKSLIATQSKRDRIILSKKVTLVKSVEKLVQPHKRKMEALVKTSPFKTCTGNFFLTLLPSLNHIPLFVQSYLTNSLV